MPEPGQPLRAVRFGAFEADFQSGELRKHGLKLRLQDQPFQILAMLLERRGKMVTREELHQRLWPTDTFVDFDHGLNNAINRLREALGDTADAPHFIETLPRRGYRFIAEVDGAAPRASAPTIGTSPTELGPAATPEKAAHPPALIGSHLLARFWLPLSALAIGLATLLLVNPGRLRQRLFGGAAPTRIRSIAVLPLENLTGDPSQEYFVDGMTDALITDLAQISALRVISRTSTMQYKGSKKRLSQIAQELNVDAVVEGAVVRSADRVRIDAQLIEAATDRHLWAKSYDRQLRDVVALQGEVAEAIANEIQAKLTPSERTQLARTRPVNPEAYDAYLKGRYFWHQQRQEGYGKAIEYFEQAIEKDPDYAAAYAGLSECYRMLVFTGPAVPAENIPRAEAAARKALQLDDGLSEAHVAIAGIKYRFYYDWSAAESEFKRALELDPNSSLAHWEYSLFLRTSGRYEDAIPEARRAWELDPLSVWASGMLGAAYYIARRYDQAISQLRETAGLDPQRGASRFLLGIAYQHNGDLRHAIPELEKTVELSRRNPLHVAALGNAYAVAGRRAEAQRLLAELVRRSAREYVTPYDMAVIAVGLGRNREALDWLERAYADHSFPLATIHSWPWFDPLRSDRQFQDLERRIGLDPNQPIPR